MVLVASVIRSLISHNILYRRWPEEIRGLESFWISGQFYLYGVDYDKNFDVGDYRRIVVPAVEYYRGKGKDGVVLLISREDKIGEICDEVVEMMNDWAGRLKLPEKFYLDVGKIKGTYYLVDGGEMIGGSRVSWIV